jgi:hypothetical protein
VGILYINPRVLWIWKHVNIVQLVEGSKSYKKEMQGCRESDERLTKV